MKSRKLSHKRRRVTIFTAAAASVVAGVALVPNWSAGASTVDQPTVDKQTKATFQRLADAVFTGRTDALVASDKQQYRGRKSLSNRFHGDVRLSKSLTRNENTAVSQLRDRKKRLASLGEQYSGGKTSVTLGKTRVNGDRATAEVTETTTLTYAEAKGKEPKTTGFQAHHRLSFAADGNGNWRLTEVRDTDDGVAVNQPTAPTVPEPTTATDDNPPEATRSATTRNPAANPKNLTSGTYNYKAMADYAQVLEQLQPPTYPNFNGAGAGGDCTNFVSQALKAGGWKHEPGYTYDFHKWFGNADIQSDSFVGVNEFSWFALSSKRVTGLANVYQMDVGDVLQVDFDKDGSKDHTMIVTSRVNGVPYLTYHSTNTYNRSVASVLASYPNAAYYAYRT